MKAFSWLCLKKKCAKIINAFEKEEEIQKSKKKNKRDLESDVLVFGVDTENAKKKKKKNGGSRCLCFVENICKIICIVVHT